MACTDLAAYFEGFSEGKVGYVGCASYAAYYENIHTAEQFYGFFGNIVGIGEIPQFTEAETEYGEFVVHGPYRYDPDPVYTEGLFPYGVQDKIRYARVAVVSECIGVFPFQGFLDHRLGIYREGTVHEIVECPYVIESSGMVLVHVGQQYCVQFPDAAAKDLLAEVRTGVYDKP